MGVGNLAKGRNEIATSRSLLFTSLCAIASSAGEPNIPIFGSSSVGSRTECAVGRLRLRCPLPHSLSLCVWMQVRDKQQAHLAHVLNQI